MSRNSAYPSALAAALCLVAWSAAHAQLVAIQPMGPELQVAIRMETTGEESINVWSRTDAVDLHTVLPQVLHCNAGIKPSDAGLNAMTCLSGLRRDGLALEGVVDLAPIARQLDGSTAIQLYVGYPHLGFESLSLPMEKQPGPMRINASARFDAGTIPPMIHVRFGFRPDQLAAVYLPVVLLGLALTAATAILVRIGSAALGRPILLFGMILWMGTASVLQLGALVHILLYGSSLANLAALIVEIWPPLLCVALGVALASKSQPAEKPRTGFGEVFSTFAIIPLILTSVVGALPHLTAREWPSAFAWMVAAPLFALLRRAWIRATAGSSIRLLTDGELKERVSALVAEARRPPLKIFVASSARSQVAAAFTLPGKSIFFTAPLVRTLSKRELDAVAAHELAHFAHSSRGPWYALMLAMLLFETPVAVALSDVPGGLIAGILIPLAVLFGALRVARRREFDADMASASLTGDPRALISSLARISRNNASSLVMNPIAEWFSSHPSTHKRIHALAAAARLGTSDLATLTTIDDPGEPYQLPQEPDAGLIFTPEWQTANAGIHAWFVLLGGPCVSVSVVWLFWKAAWTGPFYLLVGIALACLVTKTLAAALLASNYARLRRKLEIKLGATGQLVGLAADTQPCLYKGRRFADAGFLSFAGGRLCYRSERTSVALNPADVVDVVMVCASPTNWARLVPMVSFRRPDSAEIEGFFLHPVNWLPTQRRLFKAIQRWKATQTSSEPTSITGFERIPGQPYPKPPIASLMWALGISSGATLIAAVAFISASHTHWWFLWYCLVIDLCVQIFMFLPSLLFRPPAPPQTEPPPQGLKPS